MESVAVIDDDGQLQNFRIQVVQLPSEVSLENLGPEFCQIIATPQLTDVENEGIITQLPRKPPDCKIRLQVAEDVDSLAEPTDDGHVKCRLCNYTTDKKANWYKHRKCHLGLRPYKCDYCNYQATNTSNLKRHMQLHSDTRRFVCQLCRTKFRQKVHLDRHILVKHGERTVQCSLCDFTCFSVDPDLKRHLSRNHLVGDGTFVVRIYVCAECNYETKDRRDMNQHRKHHRNPEPKMFCELCNYVTDLESRFYRHMMKHSGEKPYACDLCPYRGGQKEHLHLHMRKRHGAPARKRGRPRKYPLIEPDAAGDVILNETALESTPSGDQENMDAESNFGSFVPVQKTSRSATSPAYSTGLAASRKLYPCNYCSLRFSKPLTLFKHVRVQHEGASYANLDGQQSEMSCVLCDFKTAEKKLLLAHLRKHSLIQKSRKKKIFQCNLCSFSSSIFETYSNHLKEHNADAGNNVDGTVVITEGDISSEQLDGDDNELASFDNTAHMASLESMQPQDTGEVQIDNEVVDDDEELGEVVESNVDAQELEGTDLATELAYEMLAKEGLLTSLQTRIKSEQDTVVSLDRNLIVSTYQSGSGHTSQTDVDSVLTQVSSEQDLSSLSSGDFIEINGQMYKIEVAPHLEDHW